MRNVAILAALVGAAACVTTVRATSAEFPVRGGWQSCVRTRLESLGYQVAPADSAARELTARRGRVRATVTADSTRIQRITGDSADVPTIHVELNDTLQSHVDSLAVYCSRISRR